MARCSKCGYSIEDDARFCTKCGAAVSSAPVAAPPDSRKLRADIAPLLPLPLLLGGRYQLFESCGGGGMAQVYRAYDERLQGREVAVKVINPTLRSEKEFDDRFHREAGILGKLSDPHIIVAHDFGIDPTHGPYLVMEYLRGQSLKERMKQGKLPVSAAMQIGAQVLLALQHAHEQGIVHRDIKPDNLFLVQQTGSLLLVRVLDFGIARIYRDDAPQHTGQGRITLPGSVVGTPRYMAPEQLAGESVDVRADLYSLAVVLFEAMTGQLPKPSFGPTLRELCPEAPPALESLLGECLRVDPAQRPSNAMVVFERLRQLRDSQGNLLFNTGSHSSLVLPAYTESDSRSAQQSTGLIQQVRRRGLVISAAIMLLTVAASWVAYQMFARTGPVTPPDRESVLGIEIEMDRQRVVDRFGPPMRQWKGDPWATPAREHLGHLLKPNDLPLDAEPCEVWYWPESQVCIILIQNKVRAIVAGEMSDGRSGRGVRIGDRDSRLEQLYPEPPEMHNFSDAPVAKGVPPTWGMVYRYAPHGIGFELRSHRVTSITLFPPRSG